MIVTRENAGMYQYTLRVRVSRMAATDLVMRSKERFWYLGLFGTDLLDHYHQTFDPTSTSHTAEVTYDERESDYIITLGWDSTTLGNPHRVGRAITRAIYRQFDPWKPRKQWVSRGITH